MIVKQVNLLGLLWLFLLIMLAGCSRSDSSVPQISITSVSSDGHYAITINEANRAVLWDIKNKAKKAISDSANMYSAYFIKHTSYFMWQDLKDVVHVQDIKGKEILSFFNFTTYGQIMTSDLKHYFAVDKDWNLYTGYDKSQRRLMKSFLPGGDKLLNLTLSSDDKLLLTSGSGGFEFEKIPANKPDGKINLDLVTLWDVNSGEPLRKFVGNIEKTIATLSPDAKYIVSGDDNSWGYVWETKTGEKKLELWGLWSGNPIEWDEFKHSVTKFDTTGLIQPPADFLEEDPYYIIRSENIFSTRFVDLNGHYLNFYKHIPNYTVLYHVSDGRPIKYIKLARIPRPIVEYYLYDQSIDTAPEANILVMAQYYTGGIIVYKYHPDTQTLEKIWAPREDGMRLLLIAMISLLVGVLLAWLLRKNKIISVTIIVGLLILAVACACADQTRVLAASAMGLLMGMINLIFL